MEITSEYNTLIQNASDTSIDWTKLLVKTNDFELDCKTTSRLIIGKERAHKKFTIAIPTYKRQKTLIEALDSAFSQNASIEYYDVIVVDNFDENLKSNIDEIESKFGHYENFRYYQNEKNVGMFGNWNKCLQLSNSEWVIILHDDDLISSNYIETFKDLSLTEFSVVLNQHRILRQNTQIKLLSKVNGILRSYHTATLRYLDWNPLIEPSACCAMYSKNKAIDCGGFSSIFGDYGFWLKSNKFHKVIKVNQNLSTYRISINESKNINFQISSFFYQKNILNSIYDSKLIVQVMIIYFYEIFCYAYKENKEIFKHIINEFHINMILKSLFLRKFIFFFITSYKVTIGNFYSKRFKKHE